ncbi:hypothetical protein HPB52_005371 [Rhipicephalus sanguineus]|uniref:Uncharacterized protein n=1 Tax=Rhipicephalus sanguineus TaxID=34632 RepID=A0A9D4QCD4_RHISA|nr:hypothetical protein HPB52_005371 [Rhipicephalus sanguineus]
MVISVAADNDWRQKRVKTPFFDQIYQSRRRYRVQRAATYENSHQYPVDYPVFGDDYEDPTSMHTVFRYESYPYLNSS